MAPEGLDALVVVLRQKRPSRLATIRACDELDRQGDRGAGGMNQHRPTGLPPPALHRPLYFLPVTVRPTLRSLLLKAGL